MFSPPRMVDPPLLESNLLPRAPVPAPVWVGGVPVHPMGVAAVLEWIDTNVATGGRGRVNYANPHNVLLARDNSTYASVLRASDVVFCDGYGVWGASRWLGTPLPERMTMPDWSDQLFALAAARGWSLFFLGALPGVAERAAARLRARYPSSTIEAHHGYFEMDSADNERVLDAIRAANPTLLLVGMGPPRQELWIHANHERHNSAVTLAVGSLFDYMAGAQPRGPRWLTGSGGEWLWRLVHEPRRLAWRYLLGIPRFVWHILRTGAGQRLAERHG